MKIKIEIKQNQGTNCGQCKLCFEWFKKGEKFFDFPSYNEKYHFLHNRICINCLLKLLGEAVGYENITERIEQIALDNL